MSVFTGMSVLMYVLIFLAKMIEVSLATVRVVLNSRGERLKGAIIGFFEVLLWVIVVSTVLTDIAADPIKVVVYCLAFSCGNYLGVTIENKLAIGTACVQAVVHEDEQDDVTAAMREQGFGVTMLQGEGRDGAVSVLLIYMKRKAVNEAIDLIRVSSPNAVITINDVRSLQRGVIKK